MKVPAVHISEIKSFLKCRLAWRWSAPPPRGFGLEPVVSRPALHFGRLIHEALQIGYDTGRPFAEVFRELSMKEQATMPRSTLFQEEEAAISKQASLGITMLEGYQQWAVQADKHYKFLALETNWHGIRLGRRIPAAGRFDAVVERPDGLWILDFKTTKYLSTDWTTSDLQATMYVYAARKLFGKQVRGIIFRFLLKKAPWDYNQLILKKGSVTQRSGLEKLTTHKKYLEALAVATVMDLANNSADFATQLQVPKNAPLKAYADLFDGTQFSRPWHPVFKNTFTLARRLYHDQLTDLRGEQNFFWEVEEYRTDKQLRMALKHVILPAAKEMVSTRQGRWIGPTGLGSAYMTCGGCQFKEPCKLAMAGADYRSCLREEYQLRDIYRKKETK